MEALMIISFITILFFSPLIVLALIGIIVKVVNLIKSFNGSRKGTVASKIIGLILFATLIGCGPNHYNVLPHVVTKVERIDTYTWEYTYMIADGPKRYDPKTTWDRPRKFNIDDTINLTKTH